MFFLSVVKVSLFHLWLKWRPSCCIGTQFAPLLTGIHNRLSSNFCCVGNFQQYKRNWQPTCVCGCVCPFPGFLSFAQSPKSKSVCVCVRVLHDGFNFRLSSPCLTSAVVERNENKFSRSWGYVSGVWFTCGCLKIRSISVYPRNVTVQRGSALGNMCLHSGFVQKWDVPLFLPWKMPKFACGNKENRCRGRVLPPMYGGRGGDWLLGLSHYIPISLVVAH